MNIKLFAASALLALGLSATSTLASTMITQNGESVLITATAATFSSTLTATGFTMIDDFDGTLASGFTPSGGDFFTGTSGIAAAPPGDGTTYLGVQPNNSFTLTDNNASSLVAISFFMGSPDDYNGLSLTVNGTKGPINLTGTQIWGGAPAGNGDQSEGFLVTYTFSPDTVHSLTFSSTSPAFEVDNIAGMVPEPATWGLMIMGFGAAGAMLRGKRKQAVA
ncbi:MAG TPA: PEPxxWA-CTERM sorting domain-containing protein [Phenylobacterium sp.]|jgi:hypothetical protein|uniref:PEPxxWA-CTERM sorting domain-containing protein n=1 Tax=Phenylobacterium sp. TaxID=1871053 RepID=UPI002D27118A|nr:PEPxxWA-CTERM sorting domain-containing protein [Phenylobacterium sp.]HZZ66810.1 PEPxxWA-CTERM sorting domain-containing protein [Phenylobacterium sp.]